MTHEMKFSLFPIERIARNWLGVQDDNFDDSILPFEIVDGVFLEDVSQNIRGDEFDYCKRALGTEVTEHLEGVKYAIVHRYPNIAEDPKTGKLIFEPDLTKRSETLVQQVIACLRLIRPTVEHAQSMGGKIADDGSFRSFHFENPITFSSALANQKMFAIRTEDIKQLRFYAPLFIAALEGNYWKFRMGVDMFQSGFLQHTHWKVRFFMWTAALEALFTSHTNAEHRGSLVAKERIKQLLGPSQLVYPKGEIPLFDQDPHLTVEQVIDELYCLRNHIAHGDKVPDYYFNTKGREGMDGSIVSKAEMLSEAASSIVRQCLLTILKGNLIAHFQDEKTSEAYFSSLELTKRILEKRKIPNFTCPK